MNLSQPSGNGSSRVPGVRPLTGPEARSLSDFTNLRKMLGIGHERPLR